MTLIIATVGLLRFSVFDTSQINLLFNKLCLSFDKEPSLCIKNLVMSCGYGLTVYQFQVNPGMRRRRHSDNPTAIRRRTLVLSGGVAGPTGLATQRWWSARDSVYWDVRRRSRRSADPASGDPLGAGAGKGPMTPSPCLRPVSR